MSLLDIASLMRRHVVAVMVMLVIALVAGFGLEHAQPMYNETTTFDFKPQSNPFVEADSLLVTSNLIAQSMMSPQSQQLVRRAGGTASYQVSMVNLYNLEYPNYSDPYVTVSVTADNPVDVKNTFNAVTRVMTDELKAWQTGKGIRPINQIGPYVLSGTKGVVPLSGYPTRMLAALLVLAIMAIFFVANFLDNHPTQLAGLRGPLRVRWAQR